MDTVTLVGRLLVSLAAVLAVMWLISRRMRKNGRGRASGLIEILDRRQLSRGASVAVVRVGDQALVVGVTDHQVSVLGEADADEARAATENRRSAPAPLRSAAKVAGRPAARRHRVTPEARPAARRADATTTTDDDTTAPAPGATRGPLTGSALSPQTWKQTVESLRELTARSS